jgi:NADP-dependent 3-hydroxy acid dehydrogenase YdfG
MFTAPDLQEENMLLEKSNRQKVLEIEKLTHTVGELEESILAAGDVANAVHFYQNQATRLNVSEIDVSVQKFGSIPFLFVSQRY